MKTQEEQDWDLEEMYSQGVEFLRTVIAVHGAERAHEVWESMGTAMGDDVKFAVFTRMLTSEGSQRYVTVAGPFNFATNDNGNVGVSKVAAIKAVRAYSGYGLKEAKKFVEAAAGNNVSRLKASSANDGAAARREALTAMREAGLKVS